MYYTALDQLLHIFGHLHLTSPTTKRRKSWEIRNLICIEPDGGKSGMVRSPCGWGRRRLGAKGPRALEPTFASEGSPSYAGKKADVDKLWRELFSDPEDWTDHRSDKLNSRFPDFKHKKRKEKALWLNSRWIPTWVEDKLGSLPPGSIQSSTFSRNQRLSRFAEAGQHEKTMELFQQMQQNGETVNRFTVFPVLKACAKLGLLEQGRRIHQMMEPGIEADLFMASSLVDMYCKCGSIEEAETVFKQMPTRNVVAWTAMIVGYVKSGKGHRALELFDQMQGQGVDPNPVTFVGVLNACASLAALEVGRRAHEEIVSRGYELDLVVGNCLVDMYAKCGSVEEAEKVFNQLPTRDVVAWNAMIVGYVKCGEGRKALELFGQMQGQGPDPDPVTFVGVLNACATVSALEGGRRAHEEIICRGYELDVVVGTCLVSMYIKCGSIEEAEIVFNKMPRRDLVAWTAMIVGYVKHGEGHKALELFGQMQAQGVEPDAVTFVGVLNACASLGALETGRHMHEEIIRRGYGSKVIGTCLVDMYAKCGSIEEAERVFNQMAAKDVVAWNVMLVGYVICGEGPKALELFRQMQGQGLDPDTVTFAGVLNACASVGALELGRSVHDEIIQRGYELDVVMGTCLVDMYAKCESVEEADMVFNQMATRDVVAWNAMIIGFVKAGESHKALELFGQMLVQGVDPDPVTFVRVLNACANVAALEGGRRAHEEIIRRGFESDMVVGTCLVDMYAKCGSIEEAEIVFNQMPTRDLVAWNAMLSGYGIHGYAREALETFKQMCKIVEVDGVTFISLLSACSHGGLVDEGLYYFKSMSADFNITPTMEHIACVVDLLGRAGRLEDAEDFIMSMPIDPDTTVWMGLLGACTIHVNVEVGERCVKRVLELDSDNAAAYVLLANIYVTAGKLDSSAILNVEGCIEV